MEGLPDQTVKHVSDLISRLRVTPGAQVKLRADNDPGYTAGWIKKKEGKEALQTTVERLGDYQERLAAQNTYGLLVVLQGIDAAGKDGTIRHVMSKVNPQGVVVHGFKVPSHEELSHDFLWRYGSRLPARGQIGIFNRSHYEEVLVVRVHPDLLDRQQLPARTRDGNVWHRRYEEINHWERYLVDNGFKVVKLFLNLSKEEQRRRFLKRIDRPEKNWKFSAADVQERRQWDEYQHAFSEMLTHTSTDWAPWYVIPADHKWFARIAVGAIIVDALMDIDPRYPTLGEDAHAALERARVQLEAEAEAGAAPDPYEAKHPAEQTR